MPGRYEVDAHTADTGITATGPTLESVIENAAFGMFGIMYTVGDESAATAVTIEATAADASELLVDVLSGLLYESETRQLAFFDFSMERAGAATVRVAARGVPFQSAQLNGPPIKAVTYHDLRVEQSAGRWIARVIFDV